ncbi:DUF2325 domain-containing protein [Pseudaquabacterium pictum]|uniref:DUF2325 domain-containing protein n=1 Tax=Pseudaquabacterium pictum TaxID=2315236 RepID=A0A480AV51_9BURK|nr:DUF2325 domain-containing protein [Rubrivivax pictus]GCL64017.1 hypothetical protein AQPW35_30980 [Rubrivivax pictus]
MCLPRSTPRLTALTAPHPPATAGADPAAPQAATGSRRRRLWDLPGAAHCPVVGVCLPIQALRRLVDRLNGPRPQADDYALHCSVVADCRQRSAVAEALQRELDRRYALPLRHAAQAKTTEALAAWWDAALHGHDQAAGQSLAGAFWATLTHPRCTPALEDCVLGHMHMLQHQAGMATRIDMDRLEALIDENAVLGRALGAAQARHQQLAAEHQQRQAAHQAEAMQLRARLMAQDLQLAQLREAQAALEAAVPGLAARSKLVAENAAQADRIQQLERQCLQARHEAERAQRLVATLASQLQAERSGSAAAEAETDQDSPAAGSDADPPTTPVRLDNQAVLCVGGRASAVPLYRLIIERSGARFIHHDGGERDSSARLDATLAAADLVICQTGCVSHNAYWRVKDHCKRTGKRCVFVETPSSAGLKRALVQLAPACGTGPAVDAPPATPAATDG